MTPEAQRIAIAEACGWVKVGAKGQLIGQRAGTPIWSSCAEQLPDYLNDLNAIHEAEKVFNNDEVLWDKYRRDIIRQVHPHVHYMHATAAQRAEALLRTLGKWTD